MTFRYEMHREAQREYDGAVHWYAERSVPTAERFIQAVDEALSLICQYPTRWRNTYKNYYELGVKKFPYTIIYVIELGQIIVVASIHHQKRNPKGKYRKLN